MKISESFEEGWFFIYGIKRIHYYYDRISLCGRLHFDLKLIKTFPNLKDPWLCKNCLMIKNTYSDLNNLVHERKIDLNL